MRTNYSTRKRSFVVKIAVIYYVILFTLLACHAFGQDKNLKFGVSLNSTYTGSGFGSQYSTGVFVKKGKSRLETGPVFQKRDMNFSGFRANYSYTVFDGQYCPGNERLELFFFSAAMYHKSAKLGYSQMAMEKRVSRGEEQLDFKSMTFKAVEAYAGFGTRIKLTSRLKWTNSIGIGAWHTLEGPNGIDRDYNGVGSIFTTNLNFEF